MTAGAGDRYRLTYSQYRDLSEKSTVYEGLAAYRAGTPDVVDLTGAGDPVELPAGAASASLLPLLGVHPVLGRWFLPAEEASSAGNDGAAVVVISHELWKGRFGGSPEVLGRIVTIDERPFEIVGVLPRGFRIHWLSASVAGEGVAGRRESGFPSGHQGGMRSGRPTAGRRLAGSDPRSPSSRLEPRLRPSCRTSRIPPAVPV